MADAYSAAFGGFNPFKDFDVTKVMGEFKFPVVSMDQIVEAQRKNIEALTSANQTAVEGLQAVIQRQVEVARQAFEDLSKASSELMGAASPEEKAVKQADLAKRTYEQAVTNLREIGTMLAKTNGEALDKLSKRVSETLDEVKELLAKTKQ